MEKIALHRSNFTNYFGFGFLSLMGVKSIQFTPRIVNVDGASVVLVHASGYNTADASEVDCDFWPRYNATLEDIETLPKEFADVKIRIGYHTELQEKEVADPETGVVTTEKVKVVKTGAPKMIAWKDIDGIWHRFSGSRVEFDEERNRSIYSNEPAEQDAEDVAEDATAAANEEKKAE